MNDQKEDTMWPEKNAAIYAQFKWLESVYPQAKVDRAYVRRFEESVLDISTSTTQFNASPDLFGTDMKTINFVSAYLVDDHGAFAMVGQKVTAYYYWPLNFWRGRCRVEKVEYISESIRYAIQNVPPTSAPTHLVLIRHAVRNAIDPHDSLTRLTVFKPPQNGLTLTQWYTDKVASIKKQLADEVERM